MENTGKSSKDPRGDSLKAAIRRLNEQLEYAKDVEEVGNASRALAVVCDALRKHEAEQRKIGMGLSPDETVQAIVDLVDELPRDQRQRLRKALAKRLELE